MKTKTLFLVAASALITLSFSLISVNSDSKKVNSSDVDSSKSESTTSEPVGGFVSEDKI
jgi:hypothetical protein